MNKEELIKLLRNQSNLFKELNNSSISEEDFIKKEMDISSYNFNLVIAKAMCLIVADYNLIKALIYFKNHDSDAMHISALIGAFEIVCYLVVNKIFTKKNLENMNIKDDIDEQIKKYEMSIEFLNSLTDEEEIKYLSLVK